MEELEIDEEFERTLVSLLAGLRSTLQETKIPKDKPMQYWHFMESIAGLSSLALVPRITEIIGEYKQEYDGMTFVAGIAKAIAQLERFLNSFPVIEKYTITKETTEIKMALLCISFYQGKYYLMDNKYNIIVVDPVTKQTEFYEMDCPDFMKAPLFTTFMSLHPLNDRTLILAVNPVTYSKISLMRDSTAVVSDFYLDIGPENSDIQTLIVPTRTPNLLLVKMFLRRFDLIPTDQMLYPRSFFQVEVYPGSPLTQILHLKPLCNFTKFVAAGSTDYFTVIDTTKILPETESFGQTHFKVEGSILKLDTFVRGECTYVMVVSTCRLLIYLAASGSDSIDLLASFAVDERVFGFCFFQYNSSSDPVVCLMGEHGIAVWRFLSEALPVDLDRVKGRPLEPLSQVLLTPYKRNYLSVVKKLGNASYFSLYRLHPAETS